MQSTGMSKHSMAALRARRVALGLVQMNLWIREKDREAFEAAVAPFRNRATEADTPQKPPARQLEAIRASAHRLQRPKAQKPPEAPQKRAERQGAPKPVNFSAPCRLMFPVKPPAAIRNQMKDDGWQYDQLTGVWSTQEDELVEDWLPELLHDWNARVLDPFQG